MSGVPSKIIVGPTTYVHFHRKHKDYFTPDFLLSPNPPAHDQSPHVWRYTVSPDHHNTVFFYNASTKRSVWVLPVVHADGHTEELGEGEVMQAIRSPLAQPTDVNVKGEKKDATTPDSTERHDGRQVDEKIQEAPQQTEREQAGAPAGSTAVHASAPSEMPLDKSQFVSTSSLSIPSPAAQQKQQQQQQQQLSHTAAAAPQLLAAASPAVDSAFSRERVQAAVQRAQAEERPLNLSIGAGVEAASDSAQRTSLQERLAAWRAKRFSSPTGNPEGTTTASATAVPGGGVALAAPQQSSATSDTPQQQQAIAAPMQVLAGPLLAASPLSNAPSSTSPPLITSTSPQKLVGLVVEAPHSTQPVPTPNAGQGKPTSDSPTRSSEEPRRDLVEEQRKIGKTAAPRSPVASPSPPALTAAASSASRHNDTAAARERRAQDAELAKVAALLHKEKLRVMEEERAALECRRRALALEQREAEERKRMMATRAAAERHRIELDERLQEEKRRQQEALANASAAAARVCEVNQYVVKHTHLEAEAEATVADSFQYAARIATQLAATAPRPDEIKGALPSKNADGIEGPVFREHQVGHGKLDGSPLRTLPPNASRSNYDRSAATTKMMSADTFEATQRTRTRKRICYGVPFVYDGEVVDYRPARTFLTHARASTSRTGTRRELRDALSPSASLPEPPTLLTAKRDGAGTEYYDATQQHFFTGVWHEDRRDGAGVLSLPTCAVQGHWRNDRLTGSAVVQTKHAKANATFATVDPKFKSASSPSLAFDGRSDASDRGAPPHHVALHGNAAVELSNKALFVGSLKQGRVAAPYVLQLGDGDYIEWLGGDSKAAASKGKCKRNGAESSEAARPSLYNVKSPILNRTGSAAGTGECRIRFRNGDTYVGHVCDFQLHGTGYYRFAADGQSFTGSFSHGLPHGEGLMIFANGDLYKGLFVKGLFDGAGSYVCESGRYVYEGDWKAGVMSGEGSLAFANGDVWKGTFRDNARIAGAYTTIAEERPNEVS